MITSIDTPWEPDLWQRALADAYREPQMLLDDLGLSAQSDLLGIDKYATFKTLVPKGFAARMQAGKADDPLLRQVLPIAEEKVIKDGFIADPLGETDTQLALQRAPGLLQKYAGRALLLTTPACAINCRYCFRRHFPYAGHRPKDQSLALTTLAKDESIHEIILSGGDPLLLDERQLGKLLEQISAIKHIKRIRFHSRIPIVLPERVSTDLISLLGQVDQQIVMVVHCNHAQELDATTARALLALRQVGVSTLNQTVLLKGINDSAQTLGDLSERLFEQGVLPYYLHMPDKVAGTHHFYIDDATALPIYRDLQKRLSGYLVPRLVRERPGGYAKELVTAEPITLINSSSL
ncbi:MAG TPA: EF-P beta-lysylation protein EpmB [Gammaproteobacteria bacterium]|nr:EF-P beta-lysylation protein EpmB [Gammaproteobacteria bacterium]|tara:strand:+ start:2183 stop:3232 length:1050 start_codon:yes stop_codon:yes gene_type:complete